jgi:penicillin amidase
MVRLIRASIVRPMPGPDWPNLLLRLMGRRLARTSGRLAVEGLHGPLSIRRDRWGIPHVDAASAEDAWFALGFCQAQDRAFQLETLLRVGRGTLAELVGPGGLIADRMSRRIGFARVAARQLPLLAAEVRSTIDAFVAGVNAGLARGLSRRPHEFVLLRIRPSRWQPADVLAFAGLQAFSLSSNWDAELARLRVLADDGPDALADLGQASPSWLPLSVPVGAPAGTAIDRLAQDLAIFASAAPSGGGSNNWAIAGARTASGRPLLANDPHLAPRLPAPWYLVHLRCPEWEVAGASFAGSPALPIGHNGYAAWGITAGLTDQWDLFIEEVGPDGASVRQGDAFEPCDVLREPITVRGAAPVVEEVLITPRGPIITPILESVGPALSLSAVWLRGLPLRGFLDCVAIRSFEDLRNAFAEWPGPALNVVYADADGHIGYQLVGQLPVRRHGNGTLPLPGWVPGAGWMDELVPLDAMPCALDPPGGFVATANNRPIQDGAGPFLGADFAEGYRQARILEQLEGRTDWDVAACAALQMDLICIPWRELREQVLGFPAEDEATRMGLELLGAWDGELAVDSAAASVYQVWISELSERIARARAPRAWRWMLGAGFGELVPITMLHTGAAARVVRLMREQPTGWFEHGWIVEAANALGAAVTRLAAEHGSDPSAWGWGRLRTVTLRHPVGQQRRFARTFNLGPAPLGGDSSTPAQAGTGPLHPFANPGFLANARAVIDLADFEGGKWVLAGGQSGNPFSRHYRDLFPLWLAGEGIPIPWSPKAVETATVDTLLLDPRPVGAT